MTCRGSARLICPTLVGTRLPRPKSTGACYLDLSSTKDIAKALPMSAVRKRIERLMKPKADGTYKVPEELVQEWKRGDQTKILDEFRASGLDKDRPTLAGHSLL